MDGRGVTRLAWPHVDVAWALSSAGRLGLAEKQRSGLGSFYGRVSGFEDVSEHSNKPWARAVDVNQAVSQGTAILVGTAGARATIARGELRVGSWR